MVFTIPNLLNAATYPQQSDPDQRDFDALTAAFGQTGVVSGCAVTAQGTPDMTVAVAAGVVSSSGAYATVAAGNVTITTADATNPRYDLIVASSAGVKSAIAGTAIADGNTTGGEPAEAVFPAITAGSILLAAVYVPAAITTITTARIVDKRVLIVPPGSTHIVPQTSNTFDLGSSSVKFRTAYMGTRMDLPPGSAGAPSLTFGEAAVGFFSNASGQLCWVPLGDSVAKIRISSGVTFGSNIRLYWAETEDVLAGNLDVILQRDDAAGVLCQRDGTNPQAFRLYNTYGDGSNYERLNLSWAANVITIAAAAAGSGTVRGMTLGAATGAGMGFYGAAPAARTTASAASSDLATVITLANNIRTALQANGMMG